MAFDADVIGVSQTVSRLRVTLKDRVLQWFAEQHIGPDEIADKFGLLPTGGKTLLEEEDWSLDLILTIAEEFGFSVSAEVESDADVDMNYDSPQSSSGQVAVMTMSGDWACPRHTGYLQGRLADIQEAVGLGVISCLIIDARKLSRIGISGESALSGLVKRFSEQRHGECLALVVLPDQAGLDRLKLVLRTINQSTLITNSVLNVYKRFNLI